MFEDVSEQLTPMQPQVLQRSSPWAATCKHSFLIRHKYIPCIYIHKIPWFLFRFHIATQAQRYYETVFGQRCIPHLFFLLCLLGVGTAHSSWGTSTGWLSAVSTETQWRRFLFQKYLGHSTFVGFQIAYLTLLALQCPLGGVMGLDQVVQCERLESLLRPSTIYTTPASLCQWLVGTASFL